jgi:hypothetical protein
MAPHVRGSSQVVSLHYPIQSTTKTSKTGQDLAFLLGKTGGISSSGIMESLAALQREQSFNRDLSL